MDECLRVAFELARELVDSEQRDRPLPYADPSILKDRLDLSLDKKEASFEEVVGALREVMAWTPGVGSPRFLNQLYGGRDAVATMAEMVSAVANTQMHTFKVAGPHALIEREVIGRMARLAGYPDGDGTFTPGGSISNLIGLVMARNEAIEGARDQGLDGRRFTVYTSEACHYSIRKNMGLVGLGRHNLRSIPVDSVGRMDVRVLRDQISTDTRAGARPLMISATAGTTVLGAFDPLEALAEIASEYGIWLHVDGAFGASVLFCDEHRHLLRGVERSDSLAWNAHKMMGMPILCSALLVRRQGLLAAHLNESADYLFTPAGEDLDPGARSIQCGRRNDVLKLWTAWKRHGDEGFAERIRRLFRLASQVAQAIEQDPDLVLSKRPQSINVCFEVPHRSSADICRLLQRRGKALVGPGVVDGRRVIRLVCVNPDLLMKDLVDFLCDVKEVAAELPEFDNRVTAEGDSLP